MTATTTETPVLQVQDLTKRYGGLVVADGISLNLGPGEMKCLIGPNGAGKSTFVNLITGFVTQDSGTIHLNGKDLAGADPSERRRSGIARTFQTARVLESATVFANVLLALRFRNPARSLVRLSGPSASEKSRVNEVLSQVGLSDRSRHLSGSLPHGQKRLLEIAMAVADKPAVLLLDEPAAGMSVRETQEVADIIVAVSAGVATLVIDHDMAFIRRLDAGVAVLHRGALVREGRISELENDPFVQEIYLGVPENV
jgi:branched-chain amino acid transport system ATP-binding protein